MSHKRGSVPLRVSLPRAAGGAEELWLALETLVQLQAHYARLLNMHDGGARRAFESADEWVARLREMDQQEASR